jgi:hypothetical protein
VGRGSPAVGARGELGEEPRLADSRLAGQEERGRAAGLQVRDRFVHRAQLGGAPDEVVGELDHGPRGRA